MVDRIDWQPDWGGFGSDDESLRTAPMEPGDERTLILLAPVVNQRMTLSWQAQDWEEKALPNGKSMRLLRIDEKAALPQLTLEGARWVDKAGETWMTSVPSLGQVTYRTTRDDALSTEDQGQFDLGTATVVQLDKPLRNPHATRRIVYRASLTHADPAKSFKPGVTQAVKKLDDHAAELVVVAIRPDDPPSGRPRRQSPIT